LFKNNSEILQGWTLCFKEVSNSVYKVTLTDNYGRQGATTDSDLEKAITTCENYAFDIERQISKNWNKFLFDTSILKLVNKTVLEKQYHNEAFDSWYIQLAENRILVDGKNYIFSIQVYKDDWIDIKTIKLSELTFDNFIAILNSAH